MQTARDAQMRALQTKLEAAEERARESRKAETIRALELQKKALDVQIQELHAEIKVRSRRLKGVGWFG